MIRFENVSKRFGDTWAVRGVDLEIAAGEFFCLLGPSGSGKSTLMRLLAGFEQPDEGQVLLDGQDLAGRPAHLRPVNMMFQSYALFPHLTVAQNVAYGLKQEKLPKGEIAARVAEMLTLVGLSDLGARKPSQLSGGQMQRTALARALAKRPRVLLLDEPLAALDRRLRETTRAELKAIQKRLGTTFVMVTHDKDEAMGLADRIAIMRDGEVVQVAPPLEMYELPADRFVAGFLGEVNLIEVRALGVTAWRAVRPEAVGLSRTAGPDYPLAGRVVQATYLGNWTTYEIALEAGPPIRAAAVSDDNGPLAVGETVYVALRPGAVLTR